ncbi:MAG: hypothetical protein ACFFC3_04730 [Candidatus Odinarchaeota archaeon]
MIYTERGKLEEAGIEIIKYFKPIGFEIEGFQIQIEHLIGVSDTYKLIRMEW